MWYLTKIPKVAHFYWGGRQLSYLQYQTIKTFMKHNPTWQCKFYFPAVPQPDISWGSYEQRYSFKGDDYFNNVMELGIEVKKIDFTEFGLTNEMSEVHKSDFLRWHLLANEGGLWSDMDVLYVKSIDNMELNKKENAELDTIICISNYGHSIGFLLAAPNNVYFKSLWDESPKVWHKDNYQAVGVLMINQMYPDLETIRIKLPGINVASVPMTTVYPWDANAVKGIFRMSDSQKIDRDTVGIHWYAGHPLVGEFLSRTAGGVNNLPPCLISKLLKDEVGKNIIEAINLYLKPTDKVLDIGCGDGTVASRIKGQVTTLDIWEDFKPMILHDLNKLPLPFEDNSFDVVLAIDVIEHLDFEHGERLLDELKRITRHSILLLTPLWWTENHDNTDDPKSPYYQNHYNIHKCLWVVDDFIGWKRIIINTTYNNYFFGEWKKDV